MENQLKIKITELIGVSQFKRFFTGNLFNWQETALVYTTPLYLEFLEEYFDDTTCFICAEIEGAMVAYFPFLLKKTEFGTILNSLPFYGSNGGIVLTSEVNNKTKIEIYGKIFSYLEDYESDHAIISSTIISNPINPHFQNWMIDSYNYDFLDFRIGQITDLSSFSIDNFETDLFDSIKGATRRNIRKAQKENITVKVSPEQRDYDFLWETHVENIEGIGGRSKSKKFFSIIAKKSFKNFSRLYIAEKNGTPIAGLLVLFAHQTVDYFVPAIKHEFRNSQATSLLIFEAMKWSVQNGFRNWNWGGTWKSQVGVYKFKEKWGATDKKYYYFTKLRDKSFLLKTRDELLTLFPDFFFINFEELK